MDLLLKTALAGTAKVAGDPIVVDHPAAEVLDSLSSEDREHGLLVRAGVVAVCNRCGHVPAKTAERLTPAPPDRRREAAGRLVGILQSAWATNEQVLLCEFLSELDVAELRLPAELLPTALATSDATIRERLLPVLGERGRWLAALRDEWRWVHEGVEVLSADTVAAVQHRWEEGTAAERRRALTSLRRFDPGEARNWLAAVLDQEKADQRATLLEALEYGLSPADEAFLEERLDDRSEQVRRVAAQLLARLNGAALAQRMLVRAEAMLALEKTGDRKNPWKLVCNPPEEIDKTWERDGISKKPPPGRGKRAYWAEVVLSLIPVNHWSSKFSQRAQALIAAAREETFTDAVLPAWTTAAVQFSSREAAADDWLTALAAYWQERLQGAQPAARGGFAQQQAAIVGAMKPQAAEQTVRRCLRDDNDGENSAVLSLLPLLPRPWSVDFAREFLNIARATLKKRDDNYGWQWANALGTAGRALPRELFAEALKSWDLPAQSQTGRISDAMQRQVEAFSEVVRMRQSFIAELRSSRL